MPFIACSRGTLLTMRTCDTKARETKARADVITTERSADRRERREAEPDESERGE